MNTRAISSNEEQTISQGSHPNVLLITAWVVTILISLLPDIILQEVVKSSTAWLLGAKFVLLGLLILSTFVWKLLRPLRSYFMIFVVLYGAEWFFGLIGGTTLWKGWFGSTAFALNMLGVQLLRLFAAFTMLAALLIIKRHRSEVFLVKGQLSATAEPVSWLGIDRPVKWSRLGPIAALCITLGTLAFMLLAGAPSPQSLAKILPIAPAIFLLAAMNAFSEQVIYRASLLATSQDVVGKAQALLLAALYFGIAHFYGVPYGVVGVIMAAFLGWFLAKAMVETRGFFWPWFIHFCQDVAIFTFIAAGSIVPGGG